MAASLPRLLGGRGRTAHPRHPSGGPATGVAAGGARLYTETGWEDAEDALRTAEALAHTDDERGAAACERGYLAYAATLFQVRDRADEARAALGRAAALIAPGAKGRPLLDFRRGLIAENLTGSPQAARAAYRRAHAGATAHADPLLLSATWRHLAGSPCARAS